MADAQGYTLAGIVSGLLLGFGPKAWDRWIGSKKDEVEGSTLLAEGAGAVTSAAVALLQSHAAESERARAAEAQCRMDLAAANARIDANGREIDELRALVESLSRQ